MSHIPEQAELNDRFIEATMAEYDAVVQPKIDIAKATIDAIFHEADVSLVTLADDPSIKGVVTRKSPYENKAWSTREPITPTMRLDVAELRAGLPLSNHQWLEPQLNTGEAEKRYPSRKAVFEAMLTRMEELTSLPERNIELERATVEMGFRFTCSSDEHGNPFSFVGVKATEAYTRGYPGGRKSWQDDGVPILAPDFVGINLCYALYRQGEQLGFTGDNASRWFVSYRASSAIFDVPFDAINEVDPYPGKGFLVENNRNAA